MHASPVPALRPRSARAPIHDILRYAAHAPLLDYNDNPQTEASPKETRLFRATGSHTQDVQHRADETHPRPNRDRPARSRSQKRAEPRPGKAAERKESSAASVLAATRIEKVDQIMRYFE